MFSKFVALIAAAAIAQGAAAATLIQSAAFTSPVIGSACNPCTSNQRVLTSFHLGRSITVFGATFAVGGYDPARPVAVGIFAGFGNNVGPDWFDTLTFATVSPSASAHGTKLLHVAFDNVLLDQGDYYFALGAADQLVVPTFLRAGERTHLIGVDGDTQWDDQVAAFRLDGASIAATIPEPATWLMLLVGYGVTGFAVRRRTDWIRHVVS